MSNQVYSNFADRELYRSSGFVDCNTFGLDQIIPNSLDAQHVGPFLPLTANANYSYDPSTGFLTFHTEGVYSIGLITVWSLTVSDGRIEQYMLINNAVIPRFGNTSVAGKTGGPLGGSVMSSNITTKLNVGDNCTFWCSGNNTGIQTLIGSSSINRSEYFVTKLS